MLDCIKVYVSLGWPVFPVSSQNKKPFAGTNGFKDATLDWQQVEAWDKQYPDCAWGTPTSAERAALDVDPRHNGHIHLAKLEAEHGPLPVTPRVLTGGGGYHYWFRCPPGTTCKSIAKTDKPEWEGKRNKPDSITLKAIGGYVIVPPSKINIKEHDGRSYTWDLRPWEVPLADAPVWALGMKLKASAEAEAEADDPWVVKPACLDLLSHPGSPEGERRKTICQLVGMHLARGDSPATIEAMAEAWALRCAPPLPEWQKHVAGLVRREAVRMTTLPSSSSITEADSISQGGREQTNSPASADSQLELDPSLPVSAEREKKMQEGLSFPTLPPEAYHGLLGEMLRAIEPETEADPAGILLGWLCCFGNIVGRKAWVMIGPRLHHPALFVGIVGRPSDGKGDAWSFALERREKMNCLAWE